jgi:VIT1/CCC1 family predicted Fe2+/Mn2+ transporter
MAKKKPLAQGDAQAYQAKEARAGSHAVRINALRAAVLGANDGIVSTAGILTGVAGATLQFATLLTAGVAGVTAGALSMAVGEYVSVSAQRDSEAALLRLERRELEEMPEEELAELTALFEEKGLSPALAAQVAQELHAHDALAAHAETELGIDPDDLTNPVHAAGSSAGAFIAGSLLPLGAMLLAPTASKIYVTIVAVVAALTLTGYLGARWGGTPVPRAIARNVVGGLLAMGITFWIGRLIGAQFL